MSGGLPCSGKERRLNAAATCLIQLKLENEIGIRFRGREVQGWVANRRFFVAFASTTKESNRMLRQMTGETANSEVFKSPVFTSGRIMSIGKPQGKMFRGGMI